MMMGITVERTLERLRAELKSIGIELPEDTELRRSYASASQRNEGAWSWFAYHPEVHSLGGRGKDIGSHYPMWLLLGCTSWRFQTTDFGVHVDPCGDCIQEYGYVRF